MTPLELPIYYQKDEGLNLEELGIDVPLEDCESRYVSFLNIDVVEPYWCENRYLGRIWSGGQPWLSPLSYTDVKSMVTEWKR